MMIEIDRIEQVERGLKLDLRRTGVNFILLWPIALALSWASASYFTHWFKMGASGFLFLLFAFACIPNIGRLAELTKINVGVDPVFRKHLALAYIAAGLTLYAGVAVLWSQWLPILATLAAATLFIINTCIAVEE